jgi:hypothetical protein
VKTPPDVAPRAGQPRVPAREREARRVREGRAEPGGGGHAVAVLAPAGEPGLDVVGAGRLQVGLVVAVAALGGGVRILVGALVAVARRAVEPGVDGEQREARAVVDLEHLALVRPGGRRVARLAAEAQLASVGVLVAVRAGRPHPVEHQRPVAGPTGNPRVRGLQEEARGVVPEGGGLVHRRPPLGRVALRAIHLHVPVRHVVPALPAQEQHGCEDEGESAGCGEDRASHGFSPLAGCPDGPWQPLHVVGSGL